MNTQHTSDEWTIPSHVAGPDIPIIAGSRAIALVVNDEDEPIDDAEQLANARLMAAAPRLLESLAGIVATLEGAWNEKALTAPRYIQCQLGEEVKRAISAIKKAEARA